MGHRRRRAAGQEVIRLSGAIDPRSVSLGRRTSPWFWCGVFFFVTSSIGGCSSSAPESPTARRELIIGIPEGSVVSAEIGIRELSNILTLEGLTQVEVDGRPVPRLAEKWTWENGGLRLRLTLRPDVQFHD